MTTSPSGLNGVAISYKVENAGESTYSTSAPVHAGRYDVKASLTNANYQATDITGTLVISKANQAITWSNPSAITYGTALSATQLNAILTTGGGSLSYSPEAGTVLNAGENQTLTVTAAETNNYNMAQASVSINVSKATPTVSLNVGGPYTFNGSPRLVSSATVTGIGGVTIGNANVTYSKDGNPVEAPTNAGTYAVTASFTGNNNYLPAETTGVLLIHKATATLTASGLSHTYDGTAKAIHVTTNPANLSGVTVAYTMGGVNVPAANVLNAGNYLYVASLDNENYTAEQRSGTLTVAKAALVIQANNASKIYGNENPAFTAAVVSGAVSGESFSVSASSDANASSAVGDYSIVPTVTGATLNNYTVTPQNGTLTITARPITVMANAGQSKVYGESDPAVYTYQIASGSLLDNAHLTGALTRVAGENVGSYGLTKGTLTATSNYALTYTGADFVIGQRSVEIMADAKSKTYGQGDPALTYAITAGSVIGGDAFSGALGRDAGENVGNYAITLGNLSLGSNYSLTMAGNAGLAITPKAIAVTPNAGQGKVYGSADPVLTYTHSDLVGNDTFSGALSRESGSTVREYNITLGTLSLSSNYALNFVDGVKFNISPKSLTASIAAINKVYDGTPAASATGSVPAADLVTGDEVAVTVSNASFDTKNVGTGKAVTANVSITNPNYSLTSSTASTTANITAKEITGAFTAANKVYDGTNAAIVTGRSLEGVIEQDDVELIGGTATFANKNATTGKTVTLVGAVLDGADKNNYSLSGVGTTLADISAKPASVTPVANTKVYGTQDPALTGSMSGFVPTDGITASFTRAAGESVGSYAISAALQPQGELSNYAITYNTAAFDITKASLAVTANNANRAYGDDDPAFNGTVTGIVNRDAITASYTTSATKGSAIGTYPIVPTLEGEALSNYEVLATNGTLTVTKAALTAMANNKSRVYGIANPVLDGELTGVKNEDNISASYSTTATAASNVGEYAINVSLLDPDGKLSNYEVNKTEGTLTILQAPATIVLTGLSKVYNGSAQGATVTTNPENLAVNVTYAGSTALPKSAGSYGVVASINNSNYAADNATGTLIIAPKAVSATLANSGKVYDGATAAPGTTATLTGVIEGDNVTAAVTNAAFDQVGAGPRTVTATVTLAGADKGNYSLGEVANATASITPKPVTAGIAATNKVYDGTTAASATGSIPATDLVANDVVVIIVSNANFDTKNVGSGKVVSANVSITNPNYSLTSLTANTTANITPAPLTITAPSMSKYCGQVDPVAGYNCQVSGTVNGEQLVTTYIIAGTVVRPVCTESAKLSNYSVTYINGTLTINGLTLDASNASNPRSINEDVVITVSVKDGNVNVPGVTVKLLFDGVVKGTAESDANGIARFALGRLAVNVYAVTAEAGAGCSVSPVVYLPIYDPEGGFITGGGWINSPAGALEGSDVTGKANFGFVAKYRKGKNEVEGNTEFQFQAGNVSFKSSAHNAGSLVISGPKATYKGTGTIAGQAGTYDFMVIVTDGHVNGGGGYDKFRIKIWNGGNVVYDNARGTLENADLGDQTILGGGSIVIHENKVVASTPGGKKLEIAGGLEELSSARFDNYPNAFADRTTIRFAFDTEQRYVLEVYDIRGALVKKMSAGTAEAGKVYEFELDGRNLAEGVYFAKLAAGTKMQTIKMLLKK
ncbi:T9SS type A sorting domain-containing protein [Pontibacter sp. JH31]|uniref:T9SS type A sorting domain-containing protein n=1 Tax=Pontibacter aquaedesilientis TaxID=2766980 RepID=A0ABR7XCL8_9BACT|nr:T9SS type A sorting domain-containing protein [Pontibacter aquaedesilientis]